MRRTWIVLLAFASVLSGGALLFMWYMNVTPRPPALSLAVKGQEQTAALGTYCWTEWGHGLCVDMFAHVTPGDPLVTTSPFTAVVHMPSDTPSELLMEAVPVTPAEEVERTSSGERMWRLPRNTHGNAFRYNLSGRGAQRLQLDLAPGLYVLSAFAQWEGRGDAVYGFLLEVR